MFLVFLKALIIGFSIAMPVGPIGILCIKNTLNSGFRIGLATGLGAASADSFYGFLAGGGLAIISEILFSYMTYIKAIGGLALIYLAIKEVQDSKTPTDESLKIKTKGFKKTAIATFFLTLSSPATIISYVAVFAAIGGLEVKSGEIFFMIFGVFLGSLLWWITLAGLVAKIKHKLSQKMLFSIRIFSALILGGFGIYAIYSCF